MRHLLIEGDDSAAKVLSKLENGVRTVIDSGTDHQMGEKAMALIQGWWWSEGFTLRSDDAPVWETLQEIIALATLMGHTSLHDARSITTQAMPLDRWQGCRDKNGDDYQYAYRYTMIEAIPRVTAKHGVNMAPATTETMLVEVRKAVQIRKALGPERIFLLD